MYAIIKAMKRILNFFTVSIIAVFALAGVSCSNITADENAEVNFSLSKKSVVRLVRQDDSDVSSLESTVLYMALVSEDENGYAADESRNLGEYYQDLIARYSEGADGSDAESEDTIDTEGNFNFTFNAPVGSRLKPVALIYTSYAGDIENEQEMSSNVYPAYIGEGDYITVQAGENSASITMKDYSNIFDERQKEFQYYKQGEDNSYTSCFLIVYNSGYYSISYSSYSGDKEVYLQDYSIGKYKIDNPNQPTYVDFTEMFYQTGALANGSGNFVARYKGEPTRSYFTRNAAEDGSVTISFTCTFGDDLTFTFKGDINDYD